MNITILGAGQLGGSLAFALREAEGDCMITVYDAMPAHAEYLLARGAADHVAATAEAAVSEADIVVFAAPLSSYRTLATTIAGALENGTVVTDVGSVKSIMDEIAPLMPNALVVGGHPIAGSEKSGPEIAKGDLFHKKLFVLTPNEQTDDEALAIVETLWSGLGADVIQMPAAVHDQIYAYVSHLPHYIAFVAASYLFKLGIGAELHTPVLLQFLRISRSNPRMWTDVAIQNREALLPTLSTYIALLEHFATELRAGEKTDTPVDSRVVASTLLPRILASSLISAVSLHEQQSGIQLRPFGAGGMRDIVAPAATTPEDDTESISNAAPVVADHLDAVLPMFKNLETLIGAEDRDGLLLFVERMVNDAHALVAPRN